METASSRFRPMFAFPGVRNASMRSDRPGALADVSRTSRAPLADGLLVVQQSQCACVRLKSMKFNVFISGMRSRYCKALHRLYVLQWFCARSYCKALCVQIVGYSKISVQAIALHAPLGTALHAGNTDKGRSRGYETIQTGSWARHPRRGEEIGDIRDESRSSNVNKTKTNERGHPFRSGQADTGPMGGLR